MLCKWFGVDRANGEQRRQSGKLIAKHFGQEESNSKGVTEPKGSETEAQRTDEEKKLDE